MEKKKALLMIIVIMFIVSMLICIFYMTSDKDNDRNENESINNTEMNNNDNETTKKDDEISSYDAIGGHCFWYDSEGYRTNENKFKNMDISLADGSINLSIDMIKSNDREVKAYILVFIGGILHNFYVDDKLYEVYEYMQGNDFKHKEVAIKIPIDDIAVAYDNTVRIMYMLSDTGIPEKGETKFYIVMEGIMTIKDLEIKEFTADEEVEYVALEGTSWQQMSEYYGYSEKDLATEKISVFNYEVPNKFYYYNHSNKNDKYISYMVLDDVLKKDGLCLETREGYTTRKEMEFDNKPHAIQTLAIPIGNSELNVEITNGTFRVN